MGLIGRRCLALVLACLVVSANGCVLVPFVQAFKESGATEGDRMALLPPQVKKFSDARLFGNKIDALRVVAPEARAEIGRQLNEMGEGERIVKSQISDVEWSDSAYKAKVLVKVESFKMSELVVGSVTEEQRWEFSTVSGWLLTERSKVEG